MKNPIKVADGSERNLPTSIDKLEKDLYAQARSRGIEVRSFGQVLAELGYSREQALGYFKQHFKELGSSDPLAEAEYCVKTQFDLIARK